MKIDIITLFPEMFAPLYQSILGKAIEKKIIELRIIDFRDFTNNKHKKVDDYPYGGGKGLLLTPQPIVDAIEFAKKDNPNSKVILLDPTGETLTNKKAKKLSKEENLIFVNGHYEGFDERIKSFVDEEISIGDYVLTGGEIATTVVIDSISRFIPGVLGNPDSFEDESFENNLLEGPQYTKPREFRGKKVPEVLLSGNHKLIEEWRHRQSLLKTYERRKDMIDNLELSKEDKKIISELEK